MVTKSKKASSSQQVAMTHEMVNALRDMAKEMAAEIVEQLVKCGAIGNTKVIHISHEQEVNPTNIHVDESVIDVGVSTQGLEKGDKSQPLTTGQKVEDKSLEASKAKLREKLAGKKDIT